MLLGGKGGCQQCTCVPCDPCTRTCQNPHTGTAFEAVYTRFFEGAEAGNTSDGYLSASGDSDTSDPYDGMDGTGPWFQEVSGSFTLDSTQTRFPCRVLVSFWRNNYVLGAATIPPASTALTFEGVFVEVSSGAVVVGDTLIVPADGEVQITGASIPLVSGSGDQSTNDPRFYDGSISVVPQCQSASFSIRAKIEWNTQKRQHVLYGLVRECYEEGTPCATFCSGSPPPDTIYLTISNITLSGGASIAGLAGTYAMSRVPWSCSWYEYVNNTSGVNEYFTCTPGLIGGGPRTGLKRDVTVGSTVTPIKVSFSWLDATNGPICGSGVIKSGTGMSLSVTLDDTNFTTPFSADGVNPMTATCNWVLEA
jgi:hypothetical protein